MGVEREGKTLELRVFNIPTEDNDTVNVQFVCDVAKTRNGFKHTCTLFVDERELVAVKINYLNRTWERFQYQSVMLKAIDSAMTILEDRKASNRIMNALAEVQKRVE